jgi:hypothetical protein
VDETNVHVGFARSAWVATCADRQEPMQSTGQRVGLASLGDAEHGCSAARDDGLGLCARERRR